MVQQGLSPSDWALCLPEAGGLPTLVPTPGLEERLDFRCLPPREAPAPGTDERLVVHLHCHYPETLAVLLERLALCLAAQRRLVLLVTTTSSKTAAAIEPVLRVSSFVDCCERWDLLVCSNIGRNVAPLLAEVWPRLRETDLLLHLHGKRSLESRLYDDWLHSLLVTLLPDPATVELLRQTFQTCPSLGLVMPQAPESLRPYLNWGGNFELARMLATWHPRELTLSRLAPLVFPVGMMFWCRPKALQPLADLVAGLPSLPLEPIPFDGTSLHAIERLLAHGCEASGHDWALITASPPLAGVTPARISVWNPLQEDFLQTTALALRASVRQRMEDLRLQADLEQRLELRQDELERLLDQQARQSEAWHQCDQQRMVAEQARLRMEAELVGIQASRSWRWFAWLRRLRRTAG